MALVNVAYKTIKGLIRTPKLLRVIQQYLFMSGIVAALGLLLVILLPVVIPDLKDTNFSGAIQALSITLIFIVTYGAIISFARINIRSRAEQDEERVQEIDLKLKILQFNIDNVESQDYNRDLLLEEMKELKFEKSLLISESPRGWEQDISTVWGKTLVASRNRLLDEEQRLLARNRANLYYGVLAASVGAGFFMVVGTASYFNGTLQELSFDKFPFYYLLGLPIVLISEVMAIFFLRLYALTEQSIERNKNEITNIELRLTSSQLLEGKTDENKFVSLSNHLAVEERNFVLGKNESSAGVSTNRLLEIITKVIKGGVS